MTNLVSNFEYLLLLSFLTLTEFWNLGPLQDIIRAPWHKRDLSDLILMSAEKNQIKHSKPDTKFVIRCSMEMTSHNKWNASIEHFTL
jgi:hypothetical protein